MNEVSGIGFRHLTKLIENNEGLKGTLESIVLLLLLLSLASVSTSTSSSSLCYM